MRFAFGFWVVFWWSIMYFWCIEKHRGLMRVKKIAVRSWLNRNGVLNLELFKFAPDQNQPLAKRSPPRHRAWACAFIRNHHLRLFSPGPQNVGRVPPLS